MCHDSPSPGIEFSCDDCPDGYNGDGVTCSDIDDCAANPCTDVGSCTDEGPNDYSCECDFGYTFTGGTCAEVFPCDDVEANDCDANAACNHDGPGVHSCACNEGYSGDGTACDDTDGCAESPCFDHADVTCHDVPAAEDAGGAASFTCDDCPDGYNGDGVTCSDIDDCAANPCTDMGSCT
eukprot:SAG11_NODE_9509_length_905_cov_7.398263_1_plen_179_part_01